MKTLFFLLAATAFGQVKDSTRTTGRVENRLQIKAGAGQDGPTVTNLTILIAEDSAWGPKRVMLHADGKVSVYGGMTDREALELVMRRFAEYAQEKCYSTVPITGSTTFKVRGDTPEVKK